MYIIIGASSFIGVYTAMHFVKQGEKVLVTGRHGKFKEFYSQFKHVDYIELDLEKETDFDRLPKTGVEGVILLSALLPATENADLSTNENADRYFAVNTIGTIRVLEYCRKNKIEKLISTVSFADVSGSMRAHHAITEEEPRNFSFTGDHAVYVFSKNAAADTMEYYNQQHGMQNAWFRLPPVYGVGPHGSLKINGKINKSGLQVFIEHACEGSPIEIHGDGTLSRDVVYVKDVAKAFYNAMKSNQARGLYNITSGKETTLREQAEVIAQVFAKDGAHQSPIKYNLETSHNNASYLFSINKANLDFSYYPEYAEFREMMIDYKRELERGTMYRLFSNREV